MPVFQTLLGELNVHMGREKIGALAEKAHLFAPGATPDFGFLMQDHPNAVTAWQKHLGDMPPSIWAGVQAIIHQALTTTPPTQVTFAWAPGYDYEMTVWQAPDTKTTKGGITVLFKSRYPADTHPLEATGTKA